MAFYSSKFDCKKEAGPDGHDAIHAQQAWILFNRVARQAPAETVSGLWHIGWGAEDMPAAYEKQVASGTRFETPLTDISDMVGMSRGCLLYTSDAADE